VATIEAIEPKLVAVPFMDTYATYLVEIIRQSTGRECVHRLLRRG